MAGRIATQLAYDGMLIWPIGSIRPAWNWKLQVLLDCNSCEQMQVEVRSVMSVPVSVALAVYPFYCYPAVDPTYEVSRVCNNLYTC